MPVVWLAAVDALLVVAAVYVGVTLNLFRFATDLHWSPGEPLPAALACVGLALLCLVTYKLYMRRSGYRPTHPLIRILAVFLFCMGVLSLTSMALPNLFMGHAELKLGFNLVFAGVCTCRLLLYQRAEFGLRPRRILVIGTGARALNLESARGSRHANEEIVAYLAVPGAVQCVSETKILPPGTSLTEAVSRLGVDEIVLAVQQRRGGVLPLKELLDCRLRGVKVTEFSTFLERVERHVRVDALDPSWLILGEGFNHTRLRDTVKRTFDVVASLALLAVTWPVMIVTAILIKLESPGPVFYSQERVGQGGRIIRIYKFRSMCADAERDGKARWASAGDPRVTRVGNVIRKLRIDELPQIFNVLNNDMSFVGPRPERPVFVEPLTREIPYFAARHSVKPGITGWAQVRYAYAASIEDTVEKLQYDLYYVKNHSFALDLLILFETVAVVLGRKGAR
ncbi:MAG: TIGR03013 family PEP-CTERM/XrtA system glycosyltransferase [Pseudomonadota bacterium]|nr:TIGR03013 family PEP-CTERM/XrtA system glycosyltransferase [Pseudomonadota bacterium]